MNDASRKATLLHGRWSISKLSIEFDMHRESLLRRIHECGVEPSGTERGAPVYHIGEVAKKIFREAIVVSGSADFDPEALSPKERKDWHDGTKAKHDSEKSRIAVELQKEQLITIDEHRDEKARVLKEISFMLDQLPDSQAS